jgi:putative addiction module killer protein
VIELAEYLDEKGRSVFADWKTGLDPTSRARIQRALLRLEQGNLAALKSVGEGVVEMRLDFGPGFRIYLARDGATLILLLGGRTKRRQSSDIAAAITHWKDYRERKKRHGKTNPPAL